MSNLLSELRSSGNSLTVFENALNISQNNVANASTAGYAKQVASFSAVPFDSSGNLTGGVTSTTIDARDVFSEQQVQQAQTSLGNWTEQLSALSNLQSSFDISGTNGVAGSLSAFYSACSTWASTPTDTTARENVLSTAGALAAAFQQAAAAVNTAKTSADTQLGSLVDQVNKLSTAIQKDNESVMTNGSSDAAVQADLYNNLEQLSQIVPITTQTASDGTVNVIMDGQTPLVMGSTQYAISAPTVSLQSDAQVLDSNGNDITSQITGGQMGGILTARNGVLAAMGGDATQQGSLNELAQNVADRVNAILESGNISDGTTAVTGVGIFTYDATSPNTIASTIAVDSTVTSDQLAAIAPGPPEVSNGTALQLADLSTSTNSADQIDGQTYSGFYGQVVATLGTAVQTATANQAVEQSAVTQAQSLREQTSGVSLDEEAINVLQFQRSYQAISKMIEILDSVTQSAVNLIP